MNGRKLFRDYAKSKDKEAKEFVKIEQGFYTDDKLVTKDNKGKIEEITICYRDMIHWIIKTNKLK